MSNNEPAMGPRQPWKAPGPLGGQGVEGWIKPSPVKAYAIMPEDKGKWANYDGQACLADAERTAGIVGFSEVYYTAGLDTGYHINHNEDEGFYVLGGEVTFYAEGENVVAAPNTWLFVPRGRPHQFVVTEPAHLLIMNTPANFEAFIMGVPSYTGAAFPPSPWPPASTPVPEDASPTSKYRKVFWDQTSGIAQYNIEYLDHPVKCWNPPKSAWALQPEPPIQAPAPDRQMDVSKVRAYAATAEMRARLLKSYQSKGIMHISVPLANSLSTGGVMGLTEFITIPGADSGYHINHNEDEVFYILKGEVTFHAEGATVVGKPGTFVFAPRGHAHQYVVTGADGCDMLVFNLPGTFEQIVQQYNILGVDMSAHYSLLNLEVIDHLPRFQQGPPWIVEPELLR
ncbi:cupin domain-containing protein [Chloroflexota bacterium]